MKVCEIFASIQGESTCAGVPCVFVRLTGCNLRCTYCDTTYAYEEGSEMTFEGILAAVEGYGLKTVEITGGEPFLQEDTLPLITSLLDRGYRVLVETNGTQDISRVDRRAVIILDIKTPGSGMADSNNFSTLAHLKAGDEVKFVLTGRSDYDWARQFLSDHTFPSGCSVLFSPAFGTLDPRDLAEWIVRDRLDVRLNLQLQKYIYGPDARGV